MMYNHKKSWMCTNRAYLPSIFIYQKRDQADNILLSLQINRPLAHLHLQLKVWCLTAKLSPPPYLKKALIWVKAEDILPVWQLLIASAWALVVRRWTLLSASWEWQSVGYFLTGTQGCLISQVLAKGRGRKWRTGLSGDSQAEILTKVTVYNQCSFASYFFTC